MDEGVKEREPLRTAGRNANRYSHSGKQHPQTIKNRIFLQSSKPTSGCISKDNEITVSKISVPLCSLQHYSPQPQHGNNLSAHQWMNE